MTSTANNFHKALSRKNYRLGAVLVFALTLVGTQLIAVQHDHEDDLSHHVSCAICAKLSSDSHALPGPVFELSAVSPMAAVPTESRYKDAATLLTIRLRGPPLVNS